MKWYINRWIGYDQAIVCLLEEDKPKQAIELKKGKWKIYGITDNYWIFYSGTQQIAVNYEVDFWRDKTIVFQYDQLSEEEKASFLKATYQKSYKNGNYFSVN